MGTESLSTLFWILIWGGLFFVMMRYGCGAHMMGGHRRHGRGGGRADSGAGATRQDPVCGMDVEPQRAAGAAVHGGETYYFCSASCRDKFEQLPQAYVGAVDRGVHAHAGHFHD